MARWRLAVHRLEACATTAALKWAVAWGVVFGFAVLLPPSAWALIKGEVATLEYQVKNSDVILRGKCEDSVTTWSNGHFVTTYKIAVKKYLKAPGKMSLETHPVLSVSQLGGRVEAPVPLDESYPLMATLYPGEEVVLFLQSPDRVPASVRAKYERYLHEGRCKPSPLMANYRLAVLNLSKLTVVVDPKTGTDLVARIRFGRFDAPSAEALKRYVEAYESQSQSVEVQRGSERLRVPVRLGKMVPPADGGSLSIEQRIRRMQSYTSTWENFQDEVEAISRGEGKSPVPTARRMRTIQPGKE